jgi:histidyl-tRNA synthetase
LKPSIPKGTRDFSPAEMQRRNFIFDTIRNVFVRYGFQQIETPAMENLSVLEGKYGEEGDKLLFRILNSGPVLENLKPQTSNLKLSDVTEKGLRYDLTVPFARYVVQHQSEITFPFKRFQLQPVWRADRPQKGRYREFYQCDADMIGSDSLLNEVELIQMIDDVFSWLKIPVTIKLNNRKILSGIADVIGEKEKITDITIALDKIDKIGIEGVNKELKEKGISENAITKLQPLISMRGTTMEKFSSLEKLFNDSSTGKEGIKELQFMFSTISNFKLQTSNLEPDFSLARGLNYYTGAIIEVKANDVQIGSICGGGRYDDLTGIFGLSNVSGVGISFGADRIYDVMNEKNLFPDFSSESTQLLFVNFGEKEEMFCLKLLADVRKAGINAELYPDRVKIKKQMSYADDRKIPFVAFVGEEEMKTGNVKLKDMKTGEEHIIGIAQLADFIGNK